MDKSTVAGAANDYPHPQSPATGRRITFWIFGLAALLILLSTASLTFIAQMAWREADRRALESEQTRMDHTLHDLHRRIVRNQIALAQWDIAFEALGTPVDRDFIADEMIADLWNDYELDRSFLFARDGTLITQAIEDKVLLASGPQADYSRARDLAKEALRAFEDRQKTAASAFSGWYMQQSSLIDIAASTFGTIDGRPAFLSAVPILPDNGDVDLYPDYPAILVNAVYLDDGWIAELNRRLNFEHLHFQAGAPRRAHPTNHLVYSADGTVFGYFKWDHARPGHQIWLMALPLIVLLATIIAVVAIAAATRISRLTSSLEASERRNRHFARHDALTGLPNRHHFSDCLAYSLDTLPEKAFAIFACDLDRFKPVNDTYGHEAGDKVIREVADRLRTLAGEDGLVCRIGGDEFVILFPKISDKSCLAAIADRIKAALAAPVDIGGGETVEIGVSIGIARAPDCGCTEKDLFRMADLALYRAKDMGRNGVEFANRNLVGADQAGWEAHRNEY
ncbi:diguanylate cyclase domain-containing protein [Roseibium sp.]|uniref:diguanylate cyclase domain-containing protein n=1 Tax=Roseibium sp. TaxID=1936156 RepID=UPI003D12C46B